MFSRIIFLKISSTHFLEKVPQISKPLPFSAGSQLALGETYEVVPWVKPNMSPRSPVVDWDTEGCVELTSAPPRIPSRPELSRSRPRPVDAAGAGVTSDGPPENYIYIYHNL